MKPILSLLFSYACDLGLQSVESGRGLSTCPDSQATDIGWQDARRLSPSE